MIVYRDVFFCFHGHRPGKRWWNYFLHFSRFQHVSAFYYDPAFEQWVGIEWTHLGLFYGIWTDDEIPAYVTQIKMAGGEILRYKAKERVRNFPLLGFGYCVSGAKHLANIRSPAVTPDQLFCALRRRGACGAFTSVLPPAEPRNGISGPETTIDATKGS